MTEFRYNVKGESPAGKFTLSFLSRRPITDPAYPSGPTGDDLAYLRGRVRDEGVRSATARRTTSRSSSRRGSSP